MKKAAGLFEFLIVIIIVLLIFFSGFGKSGNPVDNAVKKRIQIQEKRDEAYNKIDKLQSFRQKQIEQQQHQIDQDY